MLKNIKKRFMNLQMARKFSFSFASIFIIMVVLFTIAFDYILRLYEEKLNESYQNQLEFFSAEVENRLDDFIRTSALIVTDIDVQSVISLLAMTPGSTQKAMIELRLRDILSDRIHYYRDILSVIYMSNDGRSVRVGQNPHEMPDSRLALVRQRLLDARGSFVITLPDKYYPYVQGGRHVYKRTDMSFDELGDIIFNIDLKGIAKSVMSKSSIAPAMFMICNEDSVLYMSDEIMSELPALLKSGTGYTVKRLQGKVYFIGSTTNPENGWTYIAMTPYSDIAGPGQFIKGAVWAFIVGIALTYMIFSKRIADVLTRPLGQLISSMRMVGEGRLDEAINSVSEVQHNDEVGTISREFSKMVQDLNHLIVENYENQLLLEKTRYQMLQAQINPHFLYNTLGSVNYLVRFDRKNDASMMITALSDVLRAALSKKDFSTGAEELEVLSRYIEIQKLRFGSRINFLISTRGNIDAYLLPSFILQPLVENSILHGVDPKGSTGSIDISMQATEEALMITVSDDGVGMSNEQLSMVMQGSAKTKSYGIGLKNIYDRLSILYDRFTFRIDSTVGEGTSVYIELPPSVSVKV